MDTHVEKQCVTNVKSGDFSQFFILYHSYFEDLYKYVSRRIFDVQEVERIVTVTFLNALNNYKDTPIELSFNVWLFSLARTHIWGKLNKSYDDLSKISDFCEYEDGSNEEILVHNVENMFSKLSLEEGEIMRLKFFEEVSDSDVMFVLKADPTTVGSRIYKVLKRAHFFLFGETDEVSGVYFGELSGLIARVKELQVFEMPESFKLTLRNNLNSRILNKDFSSNLESVKSDKENVKVEHTSARMQGSQDPAKIFVDAAGKLTEAERQVKYDDWRKKKEVEESIKNIKADKREEFVEVFGKIRGWLIGIPVFLFLIAFIVWGFSFLGSRLSIFDDCKNVTLAMVDFTEEEQKDLKKSFVDDLCQIYDPTYISVYKVNSNKVQVELDSESWVINYDLDTRNTKNWYVQKFARDNNSNG